MKMLKKATNKMAYAKVGIYGDAGAGKTFTAAKIAIGLYKFGKFTKPVAMFDTEPGASFIIPLFEKAGIEFYVYDESRALKDLLSFMEEAERECSIAIIDSVSHVWRDTQQSYLDNINKKRVESRKTKIAKLEFHHWGPIKSAWGEFTDKFLSSKLHCFVCGRSGSVYEYQTNEETGRKELITSGTKMATEKEMGYEPSLLIEMVKERKNESIINRALIEKDRADLLNGKEIDYPSFESFKSHFEFLNIGGEHFTSMNERDSQELFNEYGEDTFSHDMKQKTIALEKIEGLLLKYYPSQSVADKTERLKIREEIFSTLSETELSIMKIDDLRVGYKKMRELLEQRHNA